MSGIICGTAYDKLTKFSPSGIEIRRAVRLLYFLHFTLDVFTMLGGCLMNFGGCNALL